MPGTRNGGTAAAGDADGDVRRTPAGAKSSPAEDFVTPADAKAPVAPGESPADAQAVRSLPSFSRLAVDGLVTRGSAGSDLKSENSDRDPGSGSVRPIKRQRRTSDGAGTKNLRADVDVVAFENVDLAGISRAFPEEKRVELAARINARAEEVAGAWAALLLAQTGMRYAEWAHTPQRVEQTKQNTLRIVKAVVDYLTTASQAKLRRTISYIVAKRRRQGFGHEEVITSMLLLRRSFEKGCGPINGEAGFLIDAVTRVMVGEVATYLHAINPQEESAPDVCLAEEDDDELGVERPEDVNLADTEEIKAHETPHVVEDVRPPMHLFIVPDVPAQFVRARQGGSPVMLAPLWSRAAHEPAGLWTWPRGTEPLNGAIVNNRFLIEGYVASGSYGHGWKAVDLRDKKAVF